MQTNIRVGRTNFLLRVREKGQDIPWADIPPVKITQKIPQFEVGIYKDIFEITDDKVEEMQEDNLSEEELNKLSQNIIEDKKRDRSNDEEQINHRDNKVQKQHQTSKENTEDDSSGTSGSDSSKSSDDEGTNDKSIRILNSTPKLPIRNDLKHRIFTGPQTPTNSKQNTRTLVHETPAIWNPAAQGPSIQHNIEDTPVRKESSSWVEQMDQQNEQQFTRTQDGL